MVETRKENSSSKALNNFSITSRHRLFIDTPLDIQIKIGRLTKRLEDLREIRTIPATKGLFSSRKVIKHWQEPWRGKSGCLRAEFEFGKRNERSKFLAFYYRVSSVKKYCFWISFVVKIGVRIYLNKYDITGSLLIVNSYVIQMFLY